MTCTPAQVGTVWANGSWLDTAWCEGTWENSHVCPSAPIGTVWQVGSWSDLAWCQDTWANSVVPPVPTPMGATGYMRYHLEGLQRHEKLIRDDEEIIIL